MNHLHLITVTESSTTMVSASGADLSVRIAGTSFIAGDEAIRKAAEVGKLVSALTTIGVDDSDCQITNVSAEVESGLLTKTSSAIYHLCIACTSIELIGPAIAAITSQKTAKLLGVDWQYPELEKQKEELLKSAVNKTKKLAETIAQSLGVPLIGVHKLTYEVTGLDNNYRQQELSQYALSSRAKAKSQTSVANLSLSHKTNMGVLVKADYAVGTIADSGT